MSQELIRFDWAIKNILRDKTNFGVGSEKGTSRGREAQSPANRP